MWASFLFILPNHVAIADSSTCSATSPCANGACCSQWGSCGYGPDFCGKKCLSNCEAKAECGKYGKKETCPLNVCCSEFGFCGTTEDFCSITKKCQNNCGSVELSMCSENDERQLLEIGYYASWARHRSCEAYTVQNIDAHKYTHLIYAFANISKGVMIDPETADEMLEMKEFTNLKDVNPSLKVLISVGGWTFTDPGPTREEFHNIVSTENARKNFIVSVQNYLQKYGFDGIDIDYEYPTAEDRGGSPKDTENYLQLVKEMRNALNQQYLITIAAPASYWYLRHFKIGEMSEYLNFINVMTYDIHGIWDNNIQSLGPYVKSHTDIKEIEEALRLFLRAGVKSDKLVLDLGYYGRSFTLESSSCKEIGCKFSGPGKAGPCTKSPGTLAWFEINEIIANNPQNKPILDSSSMSKILTWNNDQWVSYDDKETFIMRRHYARKHCLKGVMIWSIDQDIDNKLTLTGRKTKIPFYIIAHMANTRTSLDWAIKNGANAIENDLQFDQRGNPVKFEHQHVCDCICVINDDHICQVLHNKCSGPQASDDAERHLQHAAKLVNIALIIIDSKVKSNWGKRLPEAGKAVVPFLDRNLFEYGYRGNVIIGSGEVKTYEYIKAAIEAANNSPYKTRYYFTFDQEGDDYSGVIAMLSRLTDNRVYGTGLASCLPETYYSGIEKAAEGKTNYEHGLSYIWTLDKESSMKEYIKRGVQGIVTNRVRLARRIAESQGRYIAQYSDPIPISTASIVSPNKCDCDYHPGGCTVSWPAPNEKACKCHYKALQWTCSGSVVSCDSKNKKCKNPDASFEACEIGKGDCDGY
ncbi:unnamed protein product [Adineta steineri]|uniref:Chitinase n=2 Tax=Adineta steineri TaxID=433720 RepID=A0A819H114_9BILA|nr:unnamed protein product [Adineta steineri]